MVISLQMDDLDAAAKATGMQHYSLITRLFTFYTVKHMQMWHLLVHLKEATAQQEFAFSTEWNIEMM